MPFELDITESEIYKMGQVQGIAEGKAEGRVEGARQVLVRLLEKRFGPLTRADRKRVGAGSQIDLDHWTDLSVTAGTLAEVFRKQ